MKEVAPLYKVPSHKTFKKKLIDTYDFISSIYKKRIDEAITVCLTIDIWTETMAEKSYLGVTVHFLEGIESVNCFIATRQLYNRHTSTYITETLQIICNEWNILPSKIRCIITDNGPNIVAAAKSLVPEKNHMSCFPHTINLVVESGLKNPNIVSLLAKVRNIVKWIKNSVINSDKLRQSQIEKGVAEGSTKKLILDVCTRWNSVFYMIERFIEMRKVCSELLYSDCASPEMPSSQEIEILKQLIVLLKPFEYTSKELSAENYITSSKIIPIVNCIITQLNNFSSQFTLIKEIANTLKSEMQRRFGQLEYNSHAAMSTLLDPRFKNINFQDPIALGQAIRDLRNIIKNDSQLTSSDSEIDWSPVKTSNDYDF